MNIDPACAAKAAELGEIASDLGLTKQEAEGLVTKAGSVLAHQGPTAFLLYLRTEGPPAVTVKLVKKDGKTQPEEQPPAAAKPSKKLAEQIAQAAYLLLHELNVVTLRDPGTIPGNVDDISGRKELHARASKRIAEFGQMANNLSSLIFAKQILEQFMTYLRYHVKALPEKG